MSLPKVTEIKRWRVMPGDRLIVRVAGPLTPEEISGVKFSVRSALELPLEFPILVHDASAEVEVLEQ